MSDDKNDYARFVSPTTLEIVRVLTAPAESVWEHLVDPELRQLWFCAGATGTKTGEDFIMDFDHSRISNSDPPPEVGCGDPIVMTGTIVTYDAPNVLAYNWPEEHGPGTDVTVRLKSEGENTRLTLTHDKLENPDFQKGASAGWHAHLDLLVDVISGNQRRDFWTLYASLKTEYDRRIG